MRILHILAQLPAQTGSGIYYQNLIRGLETYQHEQRAVFAVQDEAEFDFLPPSRQYTVMFRSPQLPFPIVGMSDIMPYENTIYGQMNDDMIKKWQDAFYRVLEQAQEEFHPQAVILHHLWMLASMAVDIFADAIKIGVCHNTDLRQAVQNPALVNEYVNNLHRLNKVFALSGMQKEEIETAYGIEKEKIIVLGGGYDQTVFYPPMNQPPQSKIQLVYASKIDPAKGVYALLDAFSMVCETRHNVHLTVIGTPDAQNRLRLQSYIKETAPITLLPAMRQNELASFFRSVNLFIMPSFYEGLGLTALEALACGLRVVAAQNMGLTELLGGDIGKSGVIEFVPLPRMVTVDKPCEEDMPAYINEIYQKLMLQIKRIEALERWPDYVVRELSRRSWKGISARVNEALQAREAPQSPGIRDCQT